VIFFSGIVSTVFIADVIKSYIANKLRHIVTVRFMTIMNRIVGIALFLFGFRLFYFAIEGA
jgi:hypothetical protein